MESKQTRAPATAEAYQLLKEQIVTLHLLPGQLLLVQQLSRSLGISRTPVREAIVRLTQDGLVEPAQGHKFRVAPITPQSLADLYEARLALESLAVAQVACGCPKEELAGLEEIILQMEQALADGDNQRFFDADNSFHQHILELHGNQLMLDFLQRIKDLQQRIRYFSATSFTRMGDSISEHRAILRALSQHDEAGAREAVCTHLDNVRRELGELLATGHPFLWEGGPQANGKD
jgi:DNA-binding GntR family transcriptional regulator